ncbi:MAG TPA: 1-deoxy-D-xylulose-5-phosphate synthase [Chloroflexia bacterium]|nr:1-deoxy-D-xylulose-5-phosphate synthase [Chloroflexia bacterium]
MTRLLDSITGPGDLRGLSVEELELLAQEVRQEIVSTINLIGGHYASNLGTVELTVALHRVFNSPVDKLVWDVGHQAYPHKILTGRLSRFNTIRQQGGISGFLSRDESEHDVFGAGHASTSISAGYGMAVARDLKGENFNVVSIIGDGALTGGMAYEALHNAGYSNRRFIVILNDNEMSIAPNVGAISKYLYNVRTDPRYSNAKMGVEKALTHVPFGSKFLHFGKKFKDSVKEFVVPTMIWEELGFTYLGPVDGHDVGQLIDVLEAAKQSERPVFIHALTVKGKGHDVAEEDAVKWHAVSPPGKPGAPKPTAPRFQDVFADALVKIAQEDKRVVAITAAMPDGTSLNRFAKVLPERFFDVGIAEQHAVTFAAGLATEGIKPVCAIYSTFLQRAYDQVIHDVCIQNLPVVLAMDRGGVVGDDGRTHQGAFDISYLRPIPNIVLMAPKDENELQHMLFTAVKHDGPIAFRFPRGNGYGVKMDAEFQQIPIGKAEVLKGGRDIAIIAYGNPVNAAVEAAAILANEGIEAAVINGRFAKPIDEELLTDVANNFSRVITVEEGSLPGGFGDAVLEFYHAHHDLKEPRIHCIALPDLFVDQGPQSLWRDQFNMSAEGIVREVRQHFSDLYSSPRKVAAGALSERS